MSDRMRKSGGDLFIVDNSDQDWKVCQYLWEWADIAHAFDIATGYFEIGSLLALDGQWQKLDKLRILMGDEVTRRTKRALLEGVTRQAEVMLDQSIEREKEGNDFLRGVPAVVDALQRGQIECRVYAKQKFHAKAYITHAKQAVIGSVALVGSSNFTVPGLKDNVELNIQIRREVEELQDWYERHWDEGHDVTPAMLRIIERHTRDYQPFEVYARALQEYFRGHEMSAGEWELAGAATGSRIYPILDQYQKEGYQALMKIGGQYGGAFLCDGVGLGKTFIGMMVIERLVVHERKRVALFVPKAANEPVWQAALKAYLPRIGGDFSNLAIFNHTDLQRGGDFPERLERIKEQADAIVVDEAHHFRNPGPAGLGKETPSRYRRLFEIAEGKTLFLLTATPVNNHLIDLQHMIELFSRRQADYFRGAPLGIHSLPGHFRQMEKALEQQVLGASLDGAALETNEAEAQPVLADDTLFRALVVQRSRAYVKRSQEQHAGSRATFPRRQDPQVMAYSIKKTYGGVLDMLKRAFSKEKPLFALAMYYPLAYYKGPDSRIDPLVENRQKQVVALIRSGFLKRFESSARSFELSCQMLLRKLLAFAEKNSRAAAKQRVLQRWKLQHAELLTALAAQQSGELDEDDDTANILTDDLLAAVPLLSPQEYKLDEILDETFLDLDEIAEFLDELGKLSAARDDKLKALTCLLKSDSVLAREKVLIFTEYMATARYLEEELQRAGFAQVAEVDSGSAGDRSDIIKRFAPYYNDTSSGQLAAAGRPETRILISTDVLSEGLNLQDATRLINYDLHWNPVRLMQRIGRVDRRLNPDIEARILADHPEQQGMRGSVAYWNFLPPDELDEVLRLYSRVAHKTLRISKTFGIEGKKLLTPEDNYESLREFNHAYEGTPSDTEELHLEYQKLLQDFPGLAERLDRLPSRVFSGKAHPSPEARAVFFCYALPAISADQRGEATTGAEAWSEELGVTQWYLYDMADGSISMEPGAIAELIRSGPETPRRHVLAEETLSEIRGKVDKYIKNTYLKSVQAPVGVKPALKAWMELS